MNDINKKENPCHGDCCTILFYDTQKYSLFFLHLKSPLKTIDPTEKSPLNPHFCYAELQTDFPFP